MEKTDARDIVVTLPASVDWEDYSKELAAAARGEVMNFKVNAFPNTAAGRRCYLCHRGAIVGYMVISGMSEKAFTCRTTGRRWKGKFIERTGEFHKITPIPMRGFQGFRYFSGFSADQ